MQKTIFDIAIDFYLLYDFYKDNNLEERSSNLYSELDYTILDYEASSFFIGEDNLRLRLSQHNNKIIYQIIIFIRNDGNVLSVLIGDHLFKIDYDNYNLIKYYEYNYDGYHYVTKDLQSLPFNLFEFNEYKNLLILEGLPRLEYNIEVELK